MAFTWVVLKFLGILFIDFIEKCKIVTREYYSNLLTRLDEKIREKRSDLH
jgi:hypothetical protein